MTDQGFGKKALIVEGGGMRGVFSAGVLDAFLEENFHDFDFFIGVSAGSANLAGYLAGQYGRNLRFYSEYMIEHRVFSLARMLGGGPFMDAGWIFGPGDAREPLDVDAVFQRISGKKFFIVCTDVASGRPLLLEPNRDDLRFLMRCSCSLPFITGPFPELGGRPVTDGGVSDPVPIETAFSLGARRAVVVRSRPTDVLKKREPAAGLTSFLTRKHPQLRRAIHNQPEIYNRAVGFLNDPPRGLDIIQIAPPRPLRTGRTSRKKEDLLCDYRLGLDRGRETITTLLRPWRDRTTP
ncbi:MAG: patatin family protein [Pseudomonadota bacterium]